MAFSRAEVHFRNRETGELVSEVLIGPVFQYAAKRFRLFWFLLNALINNRVFCWAFGRLQDRAGSRKNVQGFIDTFHIDLEEVELPLSEYPDLNSFFSRRLKPGVRPFVEDADVFCSPAEGKALVFQQLEERTRLPVKGAYVDIASLLGSDSLAYPYHGGSAVVVRLSPGDYHRFHFPDGGTASGSRVIPGRYFPVNPIALSIKPDLLAHNKRALTFLDSDTFGRLAYLEIAGLAVGRIVQTFSTGRVERGQEKGFFLYGGSTVVLLFQPDWVLFDEDLIANSGEGMEVQVKVGTRIGVRRR